MITVGKTELFEIHKSESTGICYLYNNRTNEYHRADNAFYCFDSKESAECYAQDLEEKYKS